MGLRAIAAIRSGIILDLPHLSAIFREGQDRHGAAESFAELQGHQASTSESWWRQGAAFHAKRCWMVLEAPKKAGKHRKQSRLSYMEGEIHHKKCTDPQVARQTCINITYHYISL